MDMILLLTGYIMVLCSGIYFGWTIHARKARSVFEALLGIMEYCGPGVISDKLYLRATIELNKYRGIKPHCYKCQYLTEWDCNQPDGAIDGNGMCTGWRARKKNILFLRGLARAWGFKSEVKK